MSESVDPVLEPSTAATSRRPKVALRVGVAVVALALVVMGSISWLNRFHLPSAWQFSLSSPTGPTHHGEAIPTTTSPPPESSSPAPPSESADSGSVDVKSWSVNDVISSTCTPGEYKANVGGDMFPNAVWGGFCQMAIDGSGRLLYGGYMSMADMGQDKKNLLVGAINPRFVTAVNPDDNGTGYYLLVAAYGLDSNELANSESDLSFLVDAYGFSPWN